MKTVTLTEALSDLYVGWLFTQERFDCDAARLDFSDWVLNTLKSDAIPLCCFDCNVEATVENPVARDGRCAKCRAK